MLEFSRIWRHVIYNNKNLEKLNKNWPNDTYVGCKAPHNLAKLIDSILNLTQELDEFEDSFEQDELGGLI